LIGVTEKAVSCMAARSAWLQEWTPPWASALSAPIAILILVSVSATEMRAELRTSSEP